MDMTYPSRRGDPVNFAHRLIYSIALRFDRSEYSERCQESSDPVFDRPIQIEGSALHRRTLGDDVSTVIFHHFSDDGQADPGSLIRGVIVQTREYMKNFFRIVGIKTDSIVLYAGQAELFFPVRWPKLSGHLGCSDDLSGDVD